MLKLTFVLCWERGAAADTYSIFPSSPSDAVTLEETNIGAVGGCSYVQESIFSDSTGRSDNESINPGFWLDEKEEQSRQQDIFNRAMIELTNGNFTPIVSTLNTPLSDLGKRQRSYYIAKVTVLIKESLAVLVPGQGTNC